MRSYNIESAGVAIAHGTRSVAGICRIPSFQINACDLVCAAVESDVRARTVQSFDGQGRAGNGAGFGDRSAAGESDCASGLGVDDIKTARIAVADGSGRVQSIG